MKKIYLVEGVSGAGKTTVGEELHKLGYTVIDADEELASFTDPETGLPTDDHNYKNWLWNEEKFYHAVEQADDGIIFICGGAMNKPDFLHNFTKVFTLHLDDETLKHRLATRTNNDYGKKPEELAFQLKMNQIAEQHSKDTGTILVDATKPLQTVIDKILSEVN
ncbi:MAG: AAA family ATPase [Candidatus Doudnabacteria bacterium]|nr:AAA family ATPase [Candidatus Doudnabacteria bacterium]